MIKTHPDIYKYSDFRKFLKDVFVYRKQIKPRITVRSVALKSGIDPSLFAKVLNNKRNLALDDMGKVAQAIGLSRSDRGQFELLARLGQSRSQVEQNELSRKVAARKKRKIQTLTSDKKDYLHKWYFPVIRELLNFYPFTGDYAKLGSLLTPQVAPAEIKKAVEFLVKRKLVKIKTDGSYKLTSSFLKPSQEFSKEIIHGFQLSMLDLAKQAIKRFNKDSRDISTLAMSLSPDGFATVRKRIIACRKEIMDIARNDSNINGVYQFNFQTFPVSAIKQKKLKSGKHV